MTSVTLMQDSLHSLLRYHKLEIYIKNFISNNIHTVTQFLPLRYTDLERLGITLVKDKRRIYDIICSLKNNGEQIGAIMDKSATSCFLDVEFSNDNIIKDETCDVIENENIKDVSLITGTERLWETKNGVAKQYLDVNNVIQDQSIDCESKISQEKDLMLNKNNEIIQFPCSMHLKKENVDSFDIKYLSNLSENSGLIENKNLNNDKVIYQPSSHVHDNILRNINRVNISANSTDLEGLCRIPKSDKNNTIFNQNNSEIRRIKVNPIDKSMNRNHTSTSTKRQNKPVSQDKRHNDTFSSTFFDSSIAFKSPGSHNQKDKSLISTIFCRKNSEKENLKQDILYSAETVPKINSKEIKHIFSKNYKMPTNVIVCVRKRPILKDDKDIVVCNDTRVDVLMPKVKLDLSKYVKTYKFIYDHCFDVDSSNIDVFDRINPLYEHVKNGGSGSIIAYGQTGTGKTHMMFKKNDGLVFLYLKKLLADFKSLEISFYEIHNNNLYDLLDYREKILLREKEGEIILSNAVQKEITIFDDAVSIIEDALILRKSNKTGSNIDSSRSHAILRINTKQETIDNDNTLIFVDLAGSERGTDRRNVETSVLVESAEINKSLLALKECIRGIDESKGYLPFRQSKLTQILKGSLLGDTMTCIIATINPGLKYIEHTMNTLRYANRLQGPKTDLSIIERDKSILSLSPEKSSGYNEIDILRYKKSENIKNSSNVLYEKNIFSINFDQENSSNSNLSSFISNENIDKQNLEILLKKRINKLNVDISKECERTSDMKLLMKTVKLLKEVKGKIYDMKL